MFGQMNTTRAKKNYALSDKAQFNIVAGKEYLYHKGFGQYIVRFDNDDVQMSEQFFSEYFVAPEKKDW